MTYAKEELLGGSSARNNNRLLIESSDLEEEEKEDGYSRLRGQGAQMSGASMMKPRNAAPLIEEEDDSAPASSASQEDLAWSLGLPKLQQQKRSRDARRIYDTMMHNKAAANPWTRTGQQTQANVSGMFGARSARIPFFEKLFGAPADNFRAGERAERREEELNATGKTVTGPTGVDTKVKAKGIGGAFKRFGWRLKNRFRGNHEVSSQVGLKEAIKGPKMSWMQRLFGARRGGGTNSPKAMGITSPKGSWADQLIDAGKVGANEDGDSSADVGGQQPAAQEDARQTAAKPYDPDQSEDESEDEKAPTGKMNFNLFPQQKLAPTGLIGGAHESNEYGNGQKNLYGNPHGTVDDNSIDNDDDKDDIGGYNQDKLNAYMHNDNGSEDDEGLDDDGDNEDVIKNFTMMMMKGDMFK